MDWHKGGSTISDKAWEAVNENGASGVLESKVSVPADWWVQIGRTWGWVSKVLGTWDDKLSEFYIKKGSIRIRSGLVRLWVVDGIEKERYMLKKDSMTK
jgi:hypothetical protein